MNVGIIDAVDPNAPLGGKEVAIVSRRASELRNTGLSISELGAKSDQITRQSLDLLSQLSRVPAVIADEATYANAGALLGVAKKVLEQSEASRKTITSPILGLKSAVDSVFNAAVDGALKVRLALTARLAEYAATQRYKAAQAASAAQAAIDAETLRLASEAATPAQAEAIMDAGIELVDKAAAQKSVTVEAHGVKTGTATIKTVVVVDLLAAARFVLNNARPEEASAIIVLSKGALKEFIKRIQGGELTPTAESFGGLQVTESDIIRNF